MESRKDKDAKATGNSSAWMMNILQSKTFSKVEMSAELAILKAAAVIPTQPPHVVMRWQQSRLGSAVNPAKLSAPEALMELWSQKTAEGVSKSKLNTFYKGVYPAMSKEFLKNFIYKGYLITGAPGMASWLMGNNLDGVLSHGQYLFVNAVIAGAIAGTGDAVCGGIPEAMATWRATSHGAQSNASFLQGIKPYESRYKAVSAMGTIINGLIAAPRETTALLYRGFIPNTLKGTFAFTTFFYTSAPIKAAVYQHYGIEANQPVPWTATLTAAVISGTTVAIFSAPFDNVKTQKQMPGSLNKSVKATMAENVKRFGYGSLFTGMPIKIGMAAAGWAISHLVTQRDRGMKHQ